MRLSPREMELIWRIVHQGYDPDRICKEMVITQHTFKAHKHSIFMKFDVDNITDAIVLAIKNGHVTLDTSEPMPTVDGCKANRIANQLINLAKELAVS